MQLKIIITLLILLTGCTGRQVQTDTTTEKAIQGRQYALEIDYAPDGNKTAQRQYWTVWEGVENSQTDVKQSEKSKVWLLWFAVVALIITNGYTWLVSIRKR